MIVHMSGKDNHTKCCKFASMQENPNADKLTNNLMNVGNNVSGFKSNCCKELNQTLYNLIYKTFCFNIRVVNIDT